MGLSFITSVQVAVIGIFLYSSLSINIQSVLCAFVLIGSVFLQKRSSRNRPNVDINPYKNKRHLKGIDSSVDNELMASAKSAVFDYVSYNAEDSVQCLERFRLIKNNTECTFARSSRLWGSPEWRRDLPLERNIERMLPTFLLFCELCPVEALDGFLIELPGDIYGESVEVFSKGVCHVLQVFSDNDPKLRKCMDRRTIHKLGWVFEFDNITFFITSFAPFYPENHSRYAHGAENCYLLLQPEISFARRDLPPDTHKTEWDNPKTSRDRIRCAFRNAGREYRMPLSVASPLAWEIVKSLGSTEKTSENYADDHFPWWKYRDSVNRSVKMVSLDV